MNISLEAWWDIVMQARHLATLVLSCVVLFRFLAQFIGRSRGARGAAGFLAATFGLYCVVNISTSVAYAVGAASAFACACAGKRKNLVLTGFLLITFYAVRMDASSIGTAIYSHLYDNFVMPAFYQARSQMQFGMFALCCSVDVAVTIALLALSCWIIRRVFPKDPKLGRMEFFLLVTPSFATIVSALVLGEFRQIVDYTAQFVRIESSSGVQSAIGLCTIIAVLVLFARYAAEKRHQAERELLQQEVGSIRQYIGSMEDFYSQMRALRHDVAGHLQTIDMLEQSGEQAKAIQYGEALLERIQPADRISTGSLVTDVIVNAQKQKAEAQGIRFESTFHFSEDTGIDPFDIALILHNAGTNAIAAAKKCHAPFIRLSSLLRGRSFFFEMRNSCTQGKEMKDAQKRDAAADREHGFGLRNIRTAAEKYGGAIETFHDGNSFVLSVLMHCPQQDSVSSQHSSSMTRSRSR